jgi:tetratricopeptide (TPR) repeat protein
MQDRNAFVSNIFSPHTRESPATAGFFTLQWVCYRRTANIIFPQISCMKVYALLIGVFVMSQLAAQEPITVANKCYEDKNYQCAIDNYTKAIQQKQYKTGDEAIIYFRMGFANNTLKKYDEAIDNLNKALTYKQAYGDAYWTLGGVYYAKEEFLSAAENYGKAADLFKTDPVSLAKIHYWRGESYMQMEKYADALTYYLLSVKSDSTYDNGYVAAGDAAYELKKYDDAIRYYTKSLNIGKNDGETTSRRYYWLGKSYRGVAKYSDAIAAQRKALEFDPKNGDAQWDIAAVYYTQKDWSNAMTEYTKTISFYKNDSASMKDLYYYRGRSYLGMKDYAKAMTDFDGILKLDPKNARGFWQKGNIYREQKKYKEALEYFNKAVPLYKNDKESLDDLLYFRGAVYLILKDTASAEADFKEAISYNANLREPNVEMGNISFARMRYNAALPYYNAGLGGYVADSAQLSQLYFKRGYANFLTGATSYTTKSDFQKSISLDSNNKSAHRYLGEAYYNDKYYALGEKEFEKCIRLYKSEKDSLAKMYQYRGIMRSSQSKYGDALSDYEQADKIKKFTTPDYVQAMAQLAFEVKDYDKTVTYFNRLLPLYKPEQIQEIMFVYYGRGRAEFEQKKKASAVADLKKALTLAPGNKEIEGWLAKAEAL